MYKTVLFLCPMMIITGCASKVKYSVVWPVAYTYPEERMVLDKYPIEHIEVEQLNAE